MFLPNGRNQGDDMLKCPLALGCCCFVLAMLMPLAIMQSVCGVEPVSRSKEVERLLAVVPKSTVSVFCIESPFKLRRWDDLTRASVFESAICFTTMVAQEQAPLSLKGIGVRCAVSAVKNIRNPKPSPTRPVIDGPFQSQRCELFLLSERLQPNWGELVAKDFNAKNVDIAGYRVLDIPSVGGTLLVAQIADDTICVSNHVGFLTDVLQLAKSVDKQKTASIESNPAFKTALSCISVPAKFWGIRLFDLEDDVNDPTSVHNAGSYAGFHDSKAVFLALELSKVDSVDVHFYYASEDSVAAMKGFSENLAQAIKVGHIRKLVTVPPVGGTPEYVVSSMTLDLTKVIVLGMDEPGVLFLGVCVLFGQGLML
jgi:hypothetical protein